MHILSFAFAFASCASLLVEAASPPRPGAGLSVRELRKAHQLKEKYPDLFLNKRQNTDAAPPWGCLTRKRFSYSEYNILSPTDVANLLVGHGRYTHTNGTEMTDSDYLDVLAEGVAQAKKRTSFGNMVRDAFGNMLMSLTLPHYKRWRDTMVDNPDAVFHLSDESSFKARDLVAIERALLAHPEFESVQVYGYKITRRFIEATQLL